MTTCNYCCYIAMKKRAKKEKKSFKQVNEDGGISIYIAGEFAAWFMELPSSCAC